MPSPFPGMDPYLEDPRMWPDVHHELLSISRELLTVRLRPKYYVRIDERVYVSDEEDPGRSVLIPDLKIAEKPEGSRQPLPPTPTAGTGVMEPVVITKLIDEEFHEAYLEVTERDTSEVVTVIEVISPSNKVSGSQGRASYLKMRHEVMGSPCHWMEIDLLRKGAPLISRELPSRSDYFVHVSRAGKRPESQVWSIRLPDRLPPALVPLKPEDGNAELDLQHVLDTAYDRADYGATVDYRKQPRVPLTPDQAAWADQILKAKGIR